MKHCFCLPSMLPSHCTAWTTAPYMVLNLSEYVQNRLIDWVDLTTFIFRERNCKIKHIFVRWFGVAVMPQTCIQETPGLTCRLIVIYTETFYGFCECLQTNSSKLFKLPPLHFQFISHTYHNLLSSSSIIIQCALLIVMHQTTHKTCFNIHSVIVQILF
jgi:hypothetical protein